MLTDKELKQKFIDMWNETINFLKQKDKVSVSDIYNLQFSFAKEYDVYYNNFPCEYARRKDEYHICENCPLNICDPHLNCLQTNSMFSHFFKNIRENNIQEAIESAECIRDSWTISV